MPSCVAVFFSFRYGRGLEDDALGVTQAASSADSITALRHVGCSGVYQRLEATAAAALTDGTVASGPALWKRVSFRSSNKAVATFTGPPCFGDGAGRRCRGLVSHK